MKKVNEPLFETISQVPYKESHRFSKSTDHESVVMTYDVDIRQTKSYRIIRRYNCTIRCSDGRIIMQRYSTSKYRLWMCIGGPFNGESVSVLEAYLRGARMYTAWAANSPGYCLVSFRKPNRVPGTKQRRAMIWVSM
jgi:hypothetical protein